MVWMVMMLENCIKTVEPNGVGAAKNQLMADLVVHQLNEQVVVQKCHESLSGSGSTLG